jgi:transcriptional regulator with XRE-family HTH domain
MVGLLEGIGHNIRRLREEKGWNQTELGFHADMSPSIVSLIENGKRNPSTATLAKIASALEVEVVDLFPKASAPSPELPFNGLEDEWREGTPDAPTVKESAAAAQVRTTATAKPKKEVRRILTLVWERKITPEEGTRQLLKDILEDSA